MRFHLTMASCNSKTGRMPVALASKDTCPGQCPLRERACNALHGKSGFFWEAVSLGIVVGDLRTFLGRILKIPEGTVWLYGLAGDLPGDRRLIDERALRSIVHAQEGLLLHALPFPSTSMALGSLGFHEDLQAQPGGDPVGELERLHSQRLCRLGGGRGPPR
jgi:hypothetical protein